MGISWGNRLWARKTAWLGVTLSLWAWAALAQEYAPGTVVNYNNGSMQQSERVTIVAATELFGKRRWTIRMADGRVFDTYPDYLSPIGAAPTRPLPAPSEAQLPSPPSSSTKSAPAASPASTPQRAACPGANNPPQDESSTRSAALAALIRHYTQTERSNSFSMYHQGQGVAVKLLSLNGLKPHQPAAASTAMAAGSPVFRFEASYRTCFVDQHDMHRRGSTRAFHYTDQTFELFRDKAGQWRVERMTYAAPTEIRPGSF